MRVSTRKQDRTGYGQKEQEDSINAYTQRRGGEIINWYSEVASGAKINRIKVSQAIEECQRTGAILVVAMLDRLHRNRAFMDLMIASRVSFIALDYPQLQYETPEGMLILNVLSSITEYEGAKIRKRSTYTHRVRRELGQTSGRPQNFSDEGRKKGLMIIDSMRNKDAHTPARKYLENIRKPNQSYQDLARELSEAKFTKPSGKPYTKTDVYRILN